MLQGQGLSNILHHYICCTAPRLAGRVLPENPIVTYNLPIAWSNDLLLHVLLSTSASHLTYVSREHELIAQKHYAITLRKMNRLLTSPSENTSDRLILLSIVLALCFFEVLIPLTFIVVLLATDIGTGGRL